MSDQAVLLENQRIAHGLAHGLVVAGVRHVVVSPGSRSTPLALAFDALDECNVHVVLDERAAAFIALGIGRATGQPAVALATSGSAGANHFPAVVEANLGRVPLLLLTADRPGELHDSGAAQTMPQRGLFGEHVRSSIALPEPGEALSNRWVRNVATRAVAAATGSPPGPVHLNVPFREPLYVPQAPAYTAEPVARALVQRGSLRLDPASLRTLADRLAAARSGAIVCGPLAPATLDEDAFRAAVVRLAESLGWPLLADATSGLRFGPPETELRVTTADVLLRDEALANALGVERILRFGQPPTGKSTNRYLAKHRDAVTLVCPDGAWLDGGGVAEHLVVADPTELCRDLANLFGQGARPAPAATSAWLAAEKNARSELASHAQAGEWEGRIVHELLNNLPNEARLHVASSMPIRDLDAFAAARSQRLAVSSNRGVNGIDGTVATGLGIAVGSRQPTAVLLGDLAYLHDLDGLEAAVTVARDAGARLVLVVVNNGGGGIFGELPIAQHPTAFERLFLTPRPADLLGVASALGIEHRVIRADALGSAVRNAFERSGVTMLEVRIDREESSARRRTAFADAARAAREASRA